MSDMQQNESFERFNESLKRAESRCRELGKELKDSNWKRVAIQLEQLRLTGTDIYKAKAITRQELLKMIDHQTQVEVAKTN